MIDVPSKIVIVDTGFIVALCHKNDKCHEKAVEVLMKLEGFSNVSYVSTAFVFQEICWLLRKKCGHVEFINFLKGMEEQPFFLVEDLPKNWIFRATTILEKYSDAELDLADVSLVVLAEKLGVGDILSVDVRDFSILRWGDNNYFNNIFLE